MSAFAADRQARVDQNVKAGLVCRFESAEKAGEYDEEARRREQAKNALERYTSQPFVRPQCCHLAAALHVPIILLTGVCRFVGL